MNQTTTDNREAKKQRFIKRTVTAVGNAIFNWLSQCEMGMSPYEPQLFMFHNGLGCEEAAAYSFMAQVKYYEEQI